MGVHRHWVPSSPVREKRLFFHGKYIHDCIELSLNQHCNRRDTTDMLPCGRQMKGPIANTLNLPSNFTCSNYFCAPCLDLEEKLPFTLDKDLCLWNVLMGVFWLRIKLLNSLCAFKVWIQVPKGQCPDSQGHLFSVNSCWWKLHNKICLPGNRVLNLYWYI